MVRHKEKVVLVDENSVGSLKEFLNRRVRVGDDFFAVLTGDVVRNELKRARAVERDHSVEVVNIRGLKIDQPLGHTCTIELEESDGLTAPKHLIGLLVIEGEFLHIDINTAVLFDELHGVG